MNQTQSSKGIYKYYLFLAVIAYLIWSPLISSGLPYFYDEDEAHHFNRQVEMLKSGDLNPKYFLKPSLNFYLRLPALYTGYLVEKAQGNLNSLDDIITRDPFGISGYAFTASHLNVIQADRIFGLLVGILIVFGVFYLSLQLSGNRRLATFASLLYLFIPLVFQHVASVGVNQPAALFALLSVILATLAIEKNQYKLVVYSAIAAGLSISCKYNALPIVLAPLVAMHLNRSSLKNFLVISTVIILSFLLGTPYLLIELPLVIEHVSYEVWHYSTAGHVGHQASPGVPQALHYLKSFASEGVGLIALTVVFLTYKNRKDQRLAPAVLFILAFLVLMISQKANFTRNLLLIMPLVAVLYSVGLRQLKYNVIILLIAILALLQPGLQTLSLRNQKAQIDSRTIAYNDLHTEKPFKRTAIDGSTLIEKFVKWEGGEKSLSRPDVARVDLEKNSLNDLYMLGYEQILLETAKLEKSNYKSNLVVSKLYPGNKNYPGRVLINPDLSLATFSPPAMRKLVNELAEFSISFTLNDQGKCVAQQSGKIWLEKKVIQLDLSECVAIGKEISLDISYYNPWENQSVELVKDDLVIGQIQLDKGNSSFTVNVNNLYAQIYLIINRVLSPKERGQNDDRNLGIELNL